MNWLEYLIYGFISGLSEFLPISSSAHQMILRGLFGVNGRSPLHDLMIHLTALASFILLNRYITTGSRRNFTRADKRHLKTAMVPIIIGAVFYPIVGSWNIGYLMLSVFLIINGLILFVPSRMINGNKTANALSGFDSVLIGTSAALGVLPGVSRMAGTLGCASARGADHNNALRWSVYLSIPAIVVMIIMDVISLGMATTYSVHFLGLILSMLGVIVGIWLGYSLMRFLAVKAGFTVFAYYSWGAALFSFILYLIV